MWAKVEMFRVERKGEWKTVAPVLSQGPKASTFIEVAHMFHFMVFDAKFIIPHLKKEGRQRRRKTYLLYPLVV